MDICLKGHCRESHGQTWHGCGTRENSHPQRGETLYLAPAMGTQEVGQGKWTLTHFTDSKGAGVAGVDLGCAAPWEVKQLHQARHHLILLLGMAQPAIATKAPGEDSLL